MIRKPLTRAMTVLLVALAATGAVQAAPDREALRERMESMTPEQRAAAKEKMRQRWESMTPEQREAAKKRFAERHPEAGQQRPQQRQGSPAPGAAASAAR